MAGYHHGNLRDAILVAAAAVIAREGLAALSLRAIAADVGVSHTAFRRHFGDREGVLNALAVQGHRWLAEELRAAQAGEFLDVGVAYVRFALTHPGHFTVMFRPDLLDNGDPELAVARAEAFEPLSAGVDELDPTDPIAAQIAGWGLVHGIATLALTGNLAGALQSAENTGGGGSSGGQASASATGGQASASTTGSQASASTTGSQAGGSATGGQAGGSATGGQAGGSATGGQAGGDSSSAEAGGSSTAAEAGGDDVEGLARRALALLYVSGNGLQP